MTRPFPSEFRKNGFHYRVIQRDGLRVLLSQQDPSGHMDYEVAILNVTPPHPRDTRALQEGYTRVESLPGSTDWGRSGWTFRTKPEAERRFDSLKPFTEPPGFTEPP